MDKLFSNFVQRVTVYASAQTVYDVLMESKSHTLLTGAPAKISKTVGGEFAVYDGYAYGKNLELFPGRRIVQSWRAREAEWPERHFSEVTFDFTRLAKDKCAISFAHRQVPTSLVKEFKDGWKRYYWDPLKVMFPARYLKKA